MEINGEMWYNKNDRVLRVKQVFRVENSEAQTEN